jgi:hypothetical protein
MILRNCLIQGNYAIRWAGGVRDGILENCTIVGNQAGSQGGGVYSSSVSNSICYSNSCGTGANYSGTPSFTYSCTTPTAAGIGNITNFPNFVAMGSGYGTSHVPGDYRLQRTSACVNRGANAGWMIAGFDLDNKRRISRGIVDMGAYEYPFVEGTMICLR